MGDAGLVALPSLPSSWRFAIYAGQPDAMVLLALGLVVFVIAVLAQRASWLGGSGPIVRPTVDLVLAVVAGAALGAPLLLPGLQLTAGGIRTGKTGTPALPLHDISAVIFQGFDGLPVAGSHWFGHLYGNTSYLESATYVGVIAVAWRFWPSRSGIVTRKCSP